MSQKRIGVLFFCLGNICRSPLAEALFIHHVQRRRLAHRFDIDSAGTAAYHVGEPPDSGSIRVAKERLGVDISYQRAQKLASHHLREFDYVVGMDRSNLANARRLEGAEEANLLLFRDFEPDPAHRGKDVPDPWGGGPSHFDGVYDIVHRCSESLLDFIIDGESI